MFTLLRGPHFTVGSGPRGVAVSPDGTTVYVADETDGKISYFATGSTSPTVTNLTVGTNPFGVAISPDGTKVFVTNDGAGTVSIIDTASKSVEGSALTVGSGPIAAAAFFILP